MTLTPSDRDPASRVALRLIAAGFAIGLLLALATSGGIATERITLGVPGVALVANAMMTLAALLALVVTMRRTHASSAAPRDGGSGRATRLHALAVLAAQILGASAGVVLVHVLLRREALGVLPWLSERPAQLMNDAVAVSGLLALVWASADGLDARLLVLAFLGVTLYRVTGAMWHLDNAPGGFHTSVQELVVAQLVGAAFALGLFRTALGRPAR